MSLLQLNKPSGLSHSLCVFPFFQYFCSLSFTGWGFRFQPWFYLFLFVTPARKRHQAPLSAELQPSHNPQHCPAPLGPHYWALSILTPLLCPLIRNKVVCLFYTYLTCRLRFAECHQSLPQHADLALIGGALNSAQMLLLWILTLYSKKFGAAICCLLWACSLQWISMTNACDPGKPVIRKGKKFTKLYCCKLFSNFTNN